MDKCPSGYLVKVSSDLYDKLPDARPWQPQESHLRDRCRLWTRWLIEWRRFETLEQHAKVCGKRFMQLSCCLATDSVAMVTDTVLKNETIIP